MCADKNVSGKRFAFTDYLDQICNKSKFLKYIPLTEHWGEHGPCATQETYNYIEYKIKIYTQRYVDIKTYI